MENCDCNKCPKFKSDECTCCVSKECKYFVDVQIVDNLYEKTRNAIMKSWDNAVIGLGQKRRGQLNSMFTILLDNIEYIFKY